MPKRISEALFNPTSAHFKLLLFYEKVLLGQVRTIDNGIARSGVGRGFATAKDTRRERPVLAVQTFGRFVSLYATVFSFSWFISRPLWVASLFPSWLSSFPLRHTPTVCS